MTENEQKLLDLFNEYNYIQAEGERDTYRPRTEKDWQGMSRPYRQYICSKHFEFVKWLVKQDSIDFIKIYDTSILHGIMVLTQEDAINRALMELAIQDDPITFLANILR